MGSDWEGNKAGENLTVRRWKGRGRGSTWNKNFLWTNFHGWEGTSLSRRTAICTPTWRDVLYILWDKQGLGDKPHLSAFRLGQEKYKFRGHVVLTCRKHVAGDVVLRRGQILKGDAHLFGAQRVENNLWCLREELWDGVVVDSWWDRRRTQASKNNRISLKWMRPRPIFIEG